jgi:hypothetical protein
MRATSVTYLSLLSYNDFNDTGGIVKIMDILLIRSHTYQG